MCLVEKSLFMKKHTVLINTKYKVIYSAYLFTLICFCLGKPIIVLHLKKETLKISYE